MKKLFLFILCATGMLSVSAQRVYYIYIETENHQSFYVKSNDEVQSSNGGFMILSNLQDSTYHYFIGFSGNPAAEAKFRIDVQARDRGFVLKNIDGAPALFDLQSLSLLRPESRRMTDTVTYAARTDDFSMLLSKAANDSTLLRTPVYARAEPVAIVTNPSRTIEDVAKEVNPAETPENTKKEEQPVVISEPTVTKNEEQQPEKVIERHTDTTAVAADVRNAVDTAKTITQPEVAESQSIPVEKPVEPDAAQVEIIAENTESLPEQPYVRSKVRRYSESSTTEGFGIVYFVEEGGERDTIRLLIPNQRISVTQTPAVETPVSRAPDTTTARPQPQFLEISSDTTQDRPLPVVVAPKRPGRSDCKVLAGENDFLRLRKAMAGKFTEEGMINEARKSFRNRCFTTEQVRNLSALFLTASGKYQFFDAAYNFVSDQDQFRNLQSEIMDDYYLNRFKALVGE